MALSIVMTLALAGSGVDDKDKRPKISVNVNPSMGTNPVRVVATADLNGGADDYEEFYCPSIEWDWGDDTKSTNAADCDPYEAGKSQIKRRYTVQHEFRRPGNYKIYIHLKARDRILGSGTTTLQVQPGVGSGPDGL